MRKNDKENRFSRRVSEATLMAEQVRDKSKISIW